MSLVARLCRKAGASGPASSTWPRCDRSKTTQAARAASYSPRASPKWAGSSQPASSAKAAPARAARSYSGVCSGMVAPSQRASLRGRFYASNACAFHDGMNLVSVGQYEAGAAGVEQALRLAGVPQRRGADLLTHVVVEAAEQEQVGLG